MSVLSIPAAAEAMTEAFKPVDLARANDAIVRMARLPAYTLMIERPETEQRG
jgi:hypothetical protein